MNHIKRVVVFSIVHFSVLFMILTGALAYAGPTCHDFLTYRGLPTLLAEIIGTKQEAEKGPNCWNFCGVLTGFNRAIYYMSHHEFAFFLESPLTEKIALSDLRQGDIVVFRVEGKNRKLGSLEAHAAVYLSGGEVATKKGPGREGGYVRDSIESQTSAFRELGASVVEYYRPVFFPDYIRKNLEVISTELLRALEELDSLEHLAAATQYNSEYNPVTGLSLPRLLRKDLESSAGKIDQIRELARSKLGSEFIVNKEQGVVTTLWQFVFFRARSLGNLF